MAGFFDFLRRNRVLFDCRQDHGITPHTTTIPGQRAIHQILFRLLSIHQLDCQGRLIQNTR